MKIVYIAEQTRQLHIISINNCKMRHNYELSPYNSTRDAELRY